VTSDVVAYLHLARVLAAFTCLTVRSPIDATHLGLGVPSYEQCLLAAETPIIVSPTAVGLDRTLRTW
jgi:hypothetical protein